MWSARTSPVKRSTDTFTLALPGGLTSTCGPRTRTDSRTENFHKATGVNSSYRMSRRMPGTPRQSFAERRANQYLAHD